MLEINDGKTYINVFDNITEAHDYLVKSKRRKEASRSSEEPDFVWSGRSLNDAYELFKYGDEDTYKRILETQQELKIKDLYNCCVRNKKQFFNDRVGYQPNVPNYLKGIPTSMINSNNNKLNYKIINIYVNMSVNGFVRSDDILKNGTIFAFIIDFLEKQGYRCNLYVGDSTQLGGGEIHCLVRIKTDREPLNLKKMAYGIANVSFERRLMFRWTEVANYTDGETWYGYGASYNETSKIKKTLEKYLKSKFIVLNHQKEFSCDIKEIKKTLEEQGIILGD